jgi:hypothetical protein
VHGAKFLDAREKVAPHLGQHSSRVDIARLCPRRARRVNVQSSGDDSDSKELDGKDAPPVSASADEVLTPRCKVKQPIV